MLKFQEHLWLSESVNFKRGNPIPNTRSPSLGTPTWRMAMKSRLVQVLVDLGISSPLTKKSLASPPSSTKMFIRQSWIGLERTSGRGRKRRKGLRLRSLAWVIQLSFFSFPFSSLAILRVQFRWRFYGGDHLFLWLFLIGMCIRYFFCITSDYIKQSTHRWRTWFRCRW